jgi:uncharacterized membrane protein
MIALWMVAAVVAVIQFGPFGDALQAVSAMAGGGYVGWKILKRTATGHW